MDVMDQVRVGMRVIDSTGADVGTVDDLKAGDPEALTSAGQEVDPGGGLLEDVARAFGSGPRVHPQAAERMLRVGYVRVDRSGVLSGHGYVEADRIRAVEGDAVHLSVPADQLLDG
ncbi:hypothetical protein [Quadrisphaera sp. DSM 44207]|uniref:hypothetical protein n=1 Tax=Quadrisphaera sp. DSM 44207 TaxID=1881057 RepID=UPI0008854DAB|nr:hypothetical protein [Quadrisphaera sp. DSM 44207]SDQ63191.1 hypothetical protein SAMN05428996_2163 [Quadrisphaera sp. DSM 44207]